ncbi:MAG: TadE/TadG family type IV pilus assembly protein [Janthinobacterium lividum]
MNALPSAARARHQMTATLARLARDRSGTSLLEFALTLPLVMAVGCWGIELSNFAICNLRVSQYALNLADNASRVGLDNNGGVTTLRETDVNDVLQGSKLEGAALALTTNGRITLTSLENVQRSFSDGTSDLIPLQRVHWQRCLGAMSGAGYDSTYPTVPTTAGSDGTRATAGTIVLNYGASATPITAPLNTGVMFVEVNYQYKPLFGSIYLTPRIVHYVASFIVRDNRSWVQVYNPSPAAVASTCDKHSA